MTQQAVFTLRIKHFVEHKSRDTHYDALYQLCDKIDKARRWLLMHRRLTLVQADGEATELPPLNCQLLGTLVDKLFSASSFNNLQLRLGVEFIFSLYSPRVVGATLSRSLT